jgi:uncharacterized protein
MAEYRQGEFCWYELGTRDIDATLGFYPPLLNWSILSHEMGEHGIYHIFQLERQDVGAAYQMSGPQFEGVPPHWMPYVWVDDVYAAAARVTELGGRIVLPALDVPSVGHMAIAQDPQGAYFAIYLGREHRGAARLAAKPGSFSWTELHTTDAAAARQFYCQLLGWTFVELPMGPGMTYTQFQVGGRPAAGMMQEEGPQFQGVSPSWMSYVSVADCDKAAARAKELGGTVLKPPQDVPNVGRFCVLGDPAGAVFAVITFLPM